MNNYRRRIAQSFIGEFLCSSIFGLMVYLSILFSKFDENFTPFVVALIIGYTAVVLVYSFMDIAPAHFNPAITLSAIVLMKFPFVEGILCILAQILGMMFSIIIILLMIPYDRDTIFRELKVRRIDDDVSFFNIFSTEYVLTFILTFVAFSVAINNDKDPNRTPRPDRTIKDKSLIIAIPIGYAIFILVLAGSQTSGGYFNPGLVLAPFIFNLFSNPNSDGMIYLLAQLLGAISAGVFQVFILNK